MNGSAIGLRLYHVAPPPLNGPVFALSSMSTVVLSLLFDFGSSCTISWIKVCLNLVGIKTKGLKNEVGASPDLAHNNV